MEVALLHSKRMESEGKKYSEIIKSSKCSGKSCRSCNKNQKKNLAPKQKKLGTNKQASALLAQIHPSITTDISIERNPNSFSGVIEIDSQTKFPLKVMDSGTLFGSEKSSGRHQKITKENTFFNLIVCNNIFDTLDWFEILLQLIVMQYPGVQIL
jgi:hypothetical protein